MSSLNIKSLLDDFDNLTEEAKTTLTKSLSQIDEGLVPSDNDVEEICQAISNLQGKYSEIFELVRHSLPSDVDISIGEPISSLMETYEIHEATSIKEELIKAKEILGEFISVRSKIAIYASALKPFQEDAEVLLTDFEGKIEKEQLQEQIAAPSLFLRAIKDEDLKSDDGLQLLETLGEMYSSHVQLGLALGSYYLPNLEPTNREANTNPSEESSTKDSSKNEKTDTAPIEIDPNTDSESIKATDNLMVDSETEAEPVQEIENEVAENPSAACEVSYLTATSKIKNAKPSASGFKNDIKKFPPFVGVLLPIFTNLGVLTEKQLYRFCVAEYYTKGGRIGTNEIETLLTHLASKGYLAAYPLNTRPEKAYCLSEYCGQVLKKDTVASCQDLWSVSFGKFFVTGGQTIEEPQVTSIIEDNELLITYLESIHQHNSKENCTTILETIKRNDNTYSVGFLDDGEVVICQLANKALVDAAPENENILLVNDTYTDFSPSNTFYRLDGKEIPQETTQAETKEETNNNSEKNSALKKHKKVAAIKTNTVTPKEIGIPSDNQKKEDDIFRFLDLEDTPSDDEFVAFTLDLLSKKKDFPHNINSGIIQPLLLTKAASFEENYDNSQALYKQLLFASALPLDDYQYSSEQLASAFADEFDCTESAKLAAYMYAMMAPEAPYDYGLINEAKAFFNSYESYFPSYPEVKPLYNDLLTVQTIIPTGFSSSVLSLLGDVESENQYVKGLQAKAHDYCTITPINTQMRALPQFYNTSFDKGSDFYTCMEIIHEDKRDELELVKACLSDYCNEQNGIFSISNEKIEKQIEETWFSVSGQKKQFTLEYGAKAQAVKQFVGRVTLMKNWVDHIESVNSSSIDISRANSLKKTLIEKIEDIIDHYSFSEKEYGSVVLWMLERLKSTLSYPNPDICKDFKELLYTGIITLDNSGVPLLDPEMASIPFYEPWRNVLKHIFMEHQDFDGVLDDINDRQSDMFDNLQQLQMIGKFIESDSEEYTISEQQLKDAKANAEHRTNLFKEQLELAYTYDRISETEKETLLGLVERYQAKFFERKDFGVWKQFLDSLNRKRDLSSERRKEQLRQRLDGCFEKLKDGKTSGILEEAKTLLEDNDNYAVTEEYLNRFDSGELDFSSEFESNRNPSNYFQDFIESDYQKIYDECEAKKGSALKHFGKKYLQRNYPNEWTVRLKDESEQFIASWPSSPSTASEQSISDLFSGLGFDVKKVQQMGDKNRALNFQLYVTPTKKSLADYRHPISSFGTQMKSPMNVVVLFGKSTAKAIVDTITSLNLGGLAIVLIDAHLSLSTRRQIGDLFHSTSKNNSFILIDRVLLLYLALKEQTQRIPALLKCTLPFTYYQPFVRDGGSTADEMFCGRSAELESIISPNGACVVYGGRQLGKTALLERARSRCSNPAEGSYAIYCNIINCKTEDQLVAKILDTIHLNTDLNIDNVSTLVDFCHALHPLFTDGTIQRFLLLLDEADNYLESIAENRYAPIQPLIDLKRETTNSFKFVLAGLHNVCRAQNATQNNGVFGQLGTPLCIKPLSPTDALSLISQPLRFLGFEIDRYPHLQTILTNTNYYPGILQFFGYTLVETVANHYNKYYSAEHNNPPFTLQDDQLGSVMNSADLNRSIRDKFRWSLELDSRYYMLARCIAFLNYFYEESITGWQGFSVEEILEIAKEFEIKCLLKETKSSISILLDEMIDMGILSSPEKNKYRLRRSSFINIIGQNIDEVETSINDNNTEEE